MADEPTAYEPGTLLGGKYRLEKLLGQGGMGAVWEAENMDIGRKVAVKVLLEQFASDPDIVARFRTEARAAAAIGHPGIVEIIDLGASPTGGAFLVMELLEGETLGARLRRVGRLDVATAGWVVSSLLEAIGAAHRKGVVHRDLKPDNIFLVEGPAAGVKVLDFGISRFRPEGEVSLTRTGVVMGTPAYMSPEQARGAKGVGPATDLYAAGAILYEALAGCPAFPGESYNEILSKVLTETPRPLSELGVGVPGPVVSFIDALLAKDPAARPPDAAAARATLAEALAALGDSPLSGTLLRPGSDSRPDFAPTEIKPDSRPPLPAALAPRALPPAAGEAHAVGKPAAPDVVDASFVPVRKKRGRWMMLGIGLLLLWGTCGMCRAVRNTGREMARSAASLAKMPIQVTETAGVDGEPGKSHVKIGFGDRPLVEVREDGKGTRVAIAGHDLVNVAEGGEPKEPGELVEVTLVAEPKAARWTVDGQPLDCEGSCTISSSRGSIRTMEASAPGYAQTRLTVAFERPRELRVQLTRLEEGAVERPLPPMPPMKPVPPLPPVPPARPVPPAMP